MRVRFLLESSKAVVLPWDYRTELTRAIYRYLNLIDSNYGEWLSKEGFRWGKRCYRLFVYSDLFPRQGRVSEKGFEGVETITWEVSSPDKRFVETLVSGVEQEGRQVTLFGATFQIIDKAMFEPPCLRSGLVFRTISPVSVSVPNPDHPRHPIYLKPDQPEFVEALEKNLIKKWQAFRGKEWNGSEFRIRVWNPKRKLIRVFDIMVLAWHLNLQMWGDEELIKFAYDAGLGVKNSQGFGMIQPL